MVLSPLDANNITSILQSLAIILAIIVTTMQSNALKRRLADEAKERDRLKTVQLEKIQTTVDGASDKRADEAYQQGIHDNANSGR